MSKRTLAMVLSIVAGLIFIVIVPKLLNGILQSPSAGDPVDSGYTAWKLLVHLLVLGTGVLCFIVARKYWRSEDERELGELQDDDEDVNNDREEGQ